MFGAVHVALTSDIQLCGEGVLQSHSFGAKSPDPGFRSIFITAESSVVQRRTLQRLLDDSSAAVESLLPTSFVPSAEAGGGYAERRLPAHMDIRYRSFVRETEGC